MKSTVDINLATGRIDECRVVQVIRLEFLRGLGIDSSPCRRVVAYYDFEGDLIVEKDPAYTPEFYQKESA